jgi:hypothetical protein
MENQFHNIKYSTPHSAANRDPLRLTPEVSSDPSFHDIVVELLREACNYIAVINRTVLNCIDDGSFDPNRV